MNEEFVTEVYTRLATHEHLLMQLYLQLAHTTPNPQDTLETLERRLANVMASIPLPKEPAEDWVIRMTQAQRADGPVLVQDFFRKVRNNLPGSKN